jgi:hypothetical protein
MTSRIVGRVFQADVIDRLAEPFQAAVGLDDLGHGFHASIPQIESPSVNRWGKKNPGREGPGKNGINSSFSLQLARLANLPAARRRCRCSDQDPSVVGLQVVTLTVALNAARHGAQPLERRQGRQIK